MLFIPFLELKIKQNLKKVKDNTIGMGLACSKEICNNLGGDLMIVSSEPGLTIFSFKLPVIAKHCSIVEPFSEVLNINDLKNFINSEEE